MLKVTELQQVPCEVVEIAPYNADDAKFGNFVRVKFEGEDSTRRYTLAKELNGAAPEVGDKGLLILEEIIRQEGARDGSGRVFNVQKRRVIGMTKKAA